MSWRGVRWSPGGRATAETTHRPTPEPRRRKARGEEWRRETQRRRGPKQRRGAGREARGRPGGAEVLRVGHVGPSSGGGGSETQGSPAIRGLVARIPEAPAPPGASRADAESAPRLPGMGSALRTGLSLETELRGREPLPHTSSRDLPPPPQPWSHTHTVPQFTLSLGAADPGAESVKEAPRHRTREPRARGAAAGLSPPNRQRGRTWDLRCTGCGGPRSAGDSHREGREAAPATPGSADQSSAALGGLPGGGDGGPGLPDPEGRQGQWGRDVRRDRFRERERLKT